MEEEKQYIVYWESKENKEIKGNGYPTTYENAKKWCEQMNKQCPSLFHYIGKAEDV